MTTRPIVRLVLFDAVGTLFRVRGSVGELYSGEARRFGFVREPVELQRAFRVAFAAMPALAFPGARETEVPALERRWWAELVGRVLDAAGAPPDFDRVAYFASVYAIFSDARGWALFDDTLPALEELGARDIELGIVSNFDGRCRAVCDALGIARYFRAVTLSSEAGVAKPDPAIYAAALARHGVRSGEALHVGDHPVQDAMAARALGMQALWLDRRGRAAPGGLTRISSLAEVPQQIGRR